MAFLDKYKGVFWLLGGGISIGLALKMRNELKRQGRQELPGMRIIPSKSKKKTFTSKRYLSGATAKPKITFTKFTDDDTSDVLVDNAEVGWIERVKGERFKNASSYARIEYVSHYSVNLAADDSGEPRDFDTIGEARKFARTFIASNKEGTNQ